MKIPTRPRVFPRSIRAVSILFLAMLGAGMAPAQTTNAPWTPPADLPAGLRYPENTDLLPGKGPLQKWAQYPRTWAERRAEFWRHRAQDQGGVVFLGDSITQSWSSLGQDFPSLKTVNRGIGADTTRGVLFRLKEDVLDLRPAAVVLLIGVNDIGNGGDPDDAAANIRAILAALKTANPLMPVVVCKVMPSDESMADKIKALDARLEQVVKNNPRWFLCDTWSIYAQADGTCKQEEFPDRLHPNQLGYAKWAAALKPILARLDLPGGKAD